MLVSSVSSVRYNSALMLFLYSTLFRRDANVREKRREQEDYAAELNGRRTTEMRGKRRAATTMVTISNMWH